MGIVLMLAFSCREDLCEYGMKYTIKGTLYNGENLKPVAGYRLFIPYKKSLVVGDSGAINTYQNMSECITDSNGGFELFYYGRIKLDYTNSVVIAGNSVQTFLKENDLYRNISQYKVYKSDSATYTIYAQKGIMKDVDRAFLAWHIGGNTVFDTLTNPKEGLMMTRRFHGNNTFAGVQIALYNKKALRASGLFESWTSRKDPDTNLIYFPHF